MKRDMDLIRRILVEVEKADDSVSIESLECDKYSLPTIGYHVELMSAHGLIDAKVTRDWGGNIVDGYIKALTCFITSQIDIAPKQRLTRPALREKG